MILRPVCKNCFNELNFETSKLGHAVTLQITPCRCEDNKYVVLVKAIENTIKDLNKEKDDDK